MKAALVVLVVTAAAAVEAQYIAAPPFGVPPTAFGTSPVGPAFQDDWLDPLRTIAGYPQS